MSDTTSRTLASTITEIMSMERELIQKLAGPRVDFFIYRDLLIEYVKQFHVVGEIVEVARKYNVYASSPVKSYDEQLKEAAYAGALAAMAVIREHRNEEERADNHLVPREHETVVSRREEVEAERS